MINLVKLWRPHNLGPQKVAAFWFREMGPRKFQGNLGEGEIL